MRHLDTHRPMDRWCLLKIAISLAELEGDFAEFGVFRGDSARHILNAMPLDRTLWLFDSFEGLPETWDYGEGQLLKGRFKCKPPNISDPRVQIVKGLFADTLDNWMLNKPLAFIHIDSDLYSSCATVLEHIECLIVPGTVIQFDDLYGYPNWETEGEMLAWNECVERNNFTYEWIGRSKKWRAALQVTNG